LARTDGCGRSVVESFTACRLAAVALVRARLIPGNRVALAYLVVFDSGPIAGMTIVTWLGGADGVP